MSTVFIFIQTFRLRTIVGGQVVPQALQHFSVLGCCRPVLGF